MKKSFMTRVLAMGLSLAMAFSMSAATNVTTASAAASPMGKTSVTMKVGAERKIALTDTAKKKYRIKKAIPTPNAQKYLSVITNDGKKAITITANKKMPKKLQEKGGAKIAVKIYKKGDAKKKVVKTANVYVVVKAKATKPVEEKLSMTATATHANEIVATFNKAVGSDAKVTLKKGTSDVANTVKIADDGKSATITLTGKLTDGTYTVTVVAGEETDSKEIVAQNEKLDAFKLGTTLKETISSYNGVSNNATAIMSYEALNQYGDKISYTAADQAIVSSIGRVTNIKPCKTTQAGTFEIEQIPSMYAIKGQQFQISIVDTVNYTGTMANETVVYGAAATAKDITLVGAYNTVKGAFKDIADGDKVDDYVLLFTAKDQYTDDMDAKAIAKEASEGAIQVTVAGGLTNIKVKPDYNKDYDQSVKEVGDVTYFAVPLTYSSSDTTKKTANAGTYRVNIVNSTQGGVFDQEYTIVDGVIISSVQISAPDVIYAEQENALDYVVTDSQGNTLTDYATLKNITITSTEDGDKFTWKKNADGTASLVYTPDEVTSDVLRKYKGTEVRGCTIKANKEVSGKLYVASKTFTVYEERIPVAVTGVKSDAARVSSGTKPLSFNPKKLIILDQYSNPFSESEIENNTHGSLCNVYVSAAAIMPSDNGIKVTGSSLTYVSGATVTGDALEATCKLTISGLQDSAINATNSAIKLTFFVSSAAARCVNNRKDTDLPDEGSTVSFTYGDTHKVSGLTIASINGGCPLYANGVNVNAVLDQSENEWASGSRSGNYTTGYVTVKGTIGGKTGVVPKTQWQFVGAEGNGTLKLAGVKDYELAGEVITETREFSIVVDTADGPQTLTGKVDVSNAPRVGKTISANAGNVAWSFASTATVSAASTSALFTDKSQYNEVITGVSLLTYTVNDLVVSGGSISIDGGSAIASGKSISVDFVKQNLPGTNVNKFWLDGKTIAASGSEDVSLVAYIRVTAQASKDSDKTATKDIAVEFKLNY